MRLSQKIQLAVILAVLSSCGALGCIRGLTPAQQAQVDRVKCEVAALEPLALQDADYAVRQLDSGGLSLDMLITVVPEVKTNADTIKAAFKSCRAQFPKPTPDAGAGG